MPKCVRIDTRRDGIAVCTIDVPNASVNVISSAVFDEIEAWIPAVRDDSSIRGVVLASGKRDNFIAGGDLGELRTMRTPEEAEAFARRAHAFLDRIATSSKPFVAAIHGAAIGGGLETALACHGRIATDHPRTVLALPEVMVGLLPGAGGTQRLPRLIGLEKSLPMLLVGKRIRARKALHYGLIHAIANGELVDEAARLAIQLAEGRLARRAARSLRRRVVEFAPLRAMMLRRAKDEVLRKTRGHYPAPLFILECVETGLVNGFAAGQEREIRLFGRLVAGPESKKLIWLFTASSGLKKGLDAEPRPVQRLAVVGAGLMGSGIASVSLPHAGVVLKDVNQETLQRSVRGLEESIRKRIARGALSVEEGAAQRAALRTAQSIDDLADADLVIEAVFEDLELKRRVLAEAEGVIRPDAVFASNTSALPIAKIAESARHPERVVGMHYFSPVPKMPLLEVIRGRQSAEWAVATAHAFGIAQGKNVIVVNDGPGFFTTRILAPFLNEAVLLLEQGTPIDVVDATMKDFGFPVGPITLLDEVGIDVAAHVSRDLGRAFASRGFAPSMRLAELAEDGFAGRKNSRGFYLYESRRKGKRKINPEVAKRFPTTSLEIFPDEITRRLVLIMVNEAAHALGEGIVSSARDADLGAVFGLGFPPFRGGPFHFVDDRGAENVVADLTGLASRYGRRFDPAPALVEAARRGERFFDS